MTDSNGADRWFFYQDTSGLWKWARLDVLGNVLGHSGSSFGSRASCVEHARESGYCDLHAAGRHASPPRDRVPSFSNFWAGPRI